MISLRTLEQKDCAKIVSWNEGKDEDFLFQWAGPNTYTYPITASQIENRLGNKDLPMFAILNNGDFVGSFELRKIADASDELLICCFILDHEARGKGYGQSALEELIQKVFADKTIRTLKLNVFSFNVSAIRCYENAGFRVEKYRQAQNSKWNSYTMSIMSKQ